MQDRRSNDSFQKEVIESLGNIKVLCEGNKCHIEALADRTTKLEHASDRQWWVTFVVTPIVIVLGHIARAMGLKI